jgi:hypothetical protein
MPVIVYSATGLKMLTGPRHQKLGPNIESVGPDQQVWESYSRPCHTLLFYWPSRLPASSDPQGGVTECRV